MATRHPETRGGFAPIDREQNSRLKRMFWNPRMKFLYVMLAGDIVFGHIIEPTVQNPPPFVRVVSNPMGQFLSDRIFDIRLASSNALYPGERPHHVD